MPPSCHRLDADLFIADLGAFKQTWRWADIKSRHLVIEIGSPSSAKSDPGIKRHLYQKRLIPEYWVVDVDQQQVEVWTPNATFPVVQRERLERRHPALVEGYMVDVAALLALN
jgi:Uma2 family endonuclease